MAHSASSKLRCGTLNINKAETQIPLDYPHRCLATCFGWVEEANFEGSRYVYFLHKILDWDLLIRRSAHPRRPYSEATLTRILSEVLAGLKQKAGVAYRNVKLSHILMDKEGQIFCDFSSRRGFSNEDTLSQGMLRISVQHYRKRFAVNGQIFAPFKSDVFSVGIAMLSLSRLELAEFSHSTHGRTGH